MCHTNFFGRIQGVTAIIGPSNLYLTGRTHEVYFPFSDGLLSQFPSLDRQLRGAYLAIELFRQIVIKGIVVVIAKLLFNFCYYLQILTKQDNFPDYLSTAKKFRSREQNWEKKKGIYIYRVLLHRARKEVTHTWFVHLPEVLWLSC